jgi:hypothetical protein
MDLPGIVATIALVLAVWLALAMAAAVAVGSTIRLRDTVRTIPQGSSPHVFAKRRSSFGSF